MTVTIAQLSDLHLGFAPDRPEPNELRLLAAISAVAELAPDLVFVTGDLTENGEAADYVRVREALGKLSCPVHPTVGNHDRRDAFAHENPATPLADGFVQYAVEAGPLRCLVLDTLEEGREGGGFCEQRADWLRARLAEEPARPTLILLHHPPVATGITWIDPDPGAGWISQLAGAIAGQTQVIGLAAGHVHAPSITHWHGVPVTVAPSVAPGLALSFAAIDPEEADERAMVLDTAPGFAVHRWDGTRLTTHFSTVPAATLAHYRTGMQPLIRKLDAERADGR